MQAFHIVSLISYIRSLHNIQALKASKIMSKSIVNVLVAATAAASLATTEAFVPVSSSRQWKQHGSPQPLSVMSYSEDAATVTESTNSKWLVDTAASFESLASQSSSSSSGPSPASSLLSSMVNDEMESMNLADFGSDASSASVLGLDKEILSADLLQAPDADSSGVPAPMDPDDVAAPGSERDLFLSLLRNNNKDGEDGPKPVVTKRKVRASVRETGQDSLKGYIKTMCNHELLNKNEEIVLAREIQVLLQYEKTREELEASLLR